MLKKIICIIMVAIMILSLTSCNSKTDAERCNELFDNVYIAEFEQDYFGIITISVKNDTEETVIVYLECDDGKYIEEGSCEIPAGRYEDVCFYDSGENGIAYITNINGYDVEEYGKVTAVKPSNHIHLSYDNLDELHNDVSGKYIENAGDKMLREQDQKAYEEYLMYGD